MALGAIATLHPDYIAAKPKWDRVRSVMRSECRHFLRNVGASESDEKYGKKRQKEYEDGATLYNFSRRTRDGMTGAIFNKPPQCDLSPELEYLLTDADGNGVGLAQQAKDQTQENIEVSRGGLLVDMPSSAGKSKADQNKGLLNPKILPYSAESIINWRIKRIGAINKLIFIVLFERYEYTDGGNNFQIQYGRQYRLLELTGEGRYQQRVWRYDMADNEIVGYKNEDGTEYKNGEVIEVKANGKHLDHIPFYFYGGQNNDHTVDDAIMGPICDLNIDHYRNSADNSESAHVVGQPTLFIAPGENISAKEWLELNPKGVTLGSRRGHNVGYGGNAFLVQANPNTLAKENMHDDEQMAVKIGAQLINATQNVTAESARIQRSADTSILAIAAQNITAAYQMALSTCALFLGIDDNKISFHLCTEFFDEVMTAQERAQWISDVNFGYMPITDMWEAYRRSGLTKKTNEELEKELKNSGIGLPGGKDNKDEDDEVKDKDVANADEDEDDEVKDKDDE